MDDADLYWIEDVHTLFGLSYANYLVLPRSLLQSMPEEWQERFCRVIQEFDHYWEGVPQASVYNVQAKDSSGKFIADPVPHYNRGRTVVEPAKT